MAENKEKQDISLPLVIVNPKSAGGNTGGRWAEIASDLATHFGAFETARTSYAGEATKIAEKATLSGRKFIIACGGDGTINEVANGIIRAGAAAELGVMPAGTGGDFRRTLGMSSNSADAARSLKYGITRAIDAGYVTYIDPDGKDAGRYFLNVSSVGLSASIIRRVKATHTLDWLPAAKLRGQANFALSTLQEVLDLAPFKLKISIDDGEPRIIETINLSVANARYFGGGMKIAPEARLSDGKLDVTNIGDISTARILLNAYTLYAGTHLDLKEVKSRHVHSIEITPVDSSDAHAIEIDGELPGKLPAKYEVIKHAIRVRVPRQRV